MLHSSLIPDKCYVKGTVNSALAIADMFLVVSIYEGIAKGGLTAMGKSFTTWGSWRSLYGEMGYARSGQELHHWYLPRLGRTGTGNMWKFKNQMWNLLPMEESHLLGYSALEVHILVHGNTIRTGVNAGSWAKAYQMPLRFYYGTPTWYKAANFSIGLRAIN